MGNKPGERPKGIEEYDDLVRLSFFSEIGKTISASRNLTELLRAMMEQIGSIFAPTSWSILLRNHKSGELTFVMVTGAGADELRGKTLRRGQGVAGWIAENGLPVIIDDVARDPRFDGSMDQTIQFKTESIIGVPLKTRTRVFGVIELVNRLSGQHFSTYDLKLLTTIADYAAIAMEKLYYIQALRRTATTDHLTGLYNRRLLMPFIKREIERSKRDGTSFCLLFIDVNNFKQVNDRRGHDAGDNVLRQVAEILRIVLRKVDFICRWGGDEFVVVLPALTKEGAERIKERLLAYPAFVALATEFEIGLSVGVQEAADGDVDEIMAAVDRDMYDEKMSQLDEEPEDMPTALEEALEGVQELTR
jgi:diguanylate cyclase (GGDEF)-like protein